MVSESWSSFTLNDVLEKIVGGGTPSRSVMEYYSGKIPWATVKDMYSTKLINTIEHITENAVVNSSTNIIPRNNVVLATRMAVGKCFLTMVDMAINQDLKALIPKSKVLNSEYLLYLIQSNKSKLESMGTGTTVKGIQLEQIKSLPILLPPIFEQSKIADILTSVDKSIEKTGEIIAQTETVKKGLMQQLFTKGIGHTRFKKTEIGEMPEEWKLFKMNEISNFISNGFVGIASPYYTEELDSINYLMSNNIRENRIDTKKLIKVSPEFNNEFQKSILKERDLLTVQSGHVGTSCVVPPEYNGANCHALIITRFSSYEDINPYFVSFYLNSIAGKKNLKKIFVGSTVPHINVKDFKKLSIPVPPIEEQQKLVSILGAVAKKITIEQQKLSQLQTLKKGLMQVLLTGKVRVKVDKPEEVVPS